MNLRHLEVFYAIMRTGSVTAAARLLNVTQPSVSAVLKHFESRSKIKLFRRVGGRLQPTPEAEAIFPEVAEIHGRLDAVERFMGDLALGRAGTLTIASSLTIANGIVAKSVASFAAKQPDVRVSLLTTTAPQVVDRVVNREVELGIAYEPVTHPEVDTESLMRHNLACVMRDDHELAKRDTIDVKALARHRLIRFSTRGVQRSIIDRALSRAGAEPRSTIEVNLSLTALVLAHYGAGIALVEPSLLSTIPLPGLVARPLTPAIELNAVLIRAKTAARSAVMTKFVAHLKSEVRASGE